jgi:hypothetical protein
MRSLVMPQQQNYLPGIAPSVMINVAMENNDIGTSGMVCDGFDH